MNVKNGFIYFLFVINVIILPIYSIVNVQFANDSLVYLVGLPISFSVTLFMQYSLQNKKLFLFNFLSLLSVFILLILIIYGNSVVKHDVRSMIAVILLSILLYRIYRARVDKKIILYPYFIIFFMMPIPYFFLLIWLGITMFFGVMMSVYVSVIFTIIIIMIVAFISNKHTKAILSNK